jgi:Na+:H+ antiporter, NhaA family
LFQQKIKDTTHLITGRVSDLLQYLLRDEASSGKFLLIATAIALTCTNSPLSTGYEHFWRQHASVGIGQWSISETLRDFINEGLMAIFFLVVGLEIKREMVRGKLRTVRAASLPIMAAIGGMIVPALIYISLNYGHAGYSGWGIPIATDIAFAVGILALIGDRVPASLKLFLLTLAVVDDIGAVIVIALFYTAHLNVVPLLLAGAIVVFILALSRLRVLNLPLFAILGVLLWVAVHASGVHASIAGAALGLAAPIVARTKTSAKRAIAERLERALIPVSTFVVIPLFALANAGAVFSISAFKQHDALLIGAGIICGLVLGKVTGILGASWLMVRFNYASLPDGMRWTHVAGVGLLGGVGFTVSLFVAELGLDSPAFLAAAKIGILIASIVSAIFGLACLLYVSRPTAERKN